MTQWVLGAGDEGHMVQYNMHSQCTAETQKKRHTDRPPRDEVHVQRVQGQDWISLQRLPDWRTKQRVQWTGPRCTTGTPFELDCCQVCVAADAIGYKHLLEDWSLLELSPP